MGILTTTQYRLTTIAAGLGILQGTAWFVMALICIVYYLDPNMGPKFDSTSSWMGTFNYGVYYHFLYKNFPAEQSDYYIIYPDTFTIFMWIYLLSNFLWVLISTLQLYFINKTARNPLNVMKCWGVLTCFISFIDILLVILIGVDYDYCYSQLENDQQALCTSVMVSVLLIAGKGFVLWIVNAIFVFVTYRIIRAVQTGKNLQRKLASTDTQIPRPTLQKTQSIYNRSQSNDSYDNYNAPWTNSNPRTSGYDNRHPPSSPFYATPQQSQQQFGRH